MTPTTHAVTLIGLSLLILGGVWAMDKRKQRRIEDSPIPTRFTPQQIARIEVIRRALNLPTRSAAIRWSVEMTYDALMEAPDANP